MGIKPTRLFAVNSQGIRLCGLVFGISFFPFLSLAYRLTAITQLAHHGMLFVPLGYTFGSGMFEMNEVKGGSAYGAGTFAADGSRQPTELELQQAFYQGKYVAEITKKLKINPFHHKGYVFKMM